MRRLINLWLKLILSSFLLVSMGALADSGLSTSSYNMSPGVTPLSHDIYQLHMTVFWICVGIAAVVFSIMIYSLIKFRKSRGAVPSQFHEHTGVEVTWAIIPFIILILMAIPATQVVIKASQAGDADLTIKVTGYQWKWKYEYLDQGISFFSNLATTQDQIHNKAEKSPDYLLEVDKPLVVPTNKKVRFLITANDVIHSWWVPQLGIKIDAIPGFIHDSWADIEKPGTYRGQCAELCGVNHAYMPIVVVAKSPEEFEQWVKQQNATKPSAATAKVIAKKVWTKDELMQQGESAYVSSCAVCHKADGLGSPPVFPSLKGSKVALGPVINHIKIVLNGVPGTAMQAFGPQLNDEDIAAIVTYQRNAWGNNTGDVVQPTQVREARGSK